MSLNAIFYNLTFESDYFYIYIYIPVINLLYVK